MQCFFDAFYFFLDFRICPIGVDRNVYRPCKKVERFWAHILVVCGDDVSIGFHFEGAFEANEAKQISVTSKGAVVEANTALLPGDML